MAITNTIFLSNNTHLVTNDALQKHIGMKNVYIHGFAIHTKASEKYVILSTEGYYSKQWYVPYFYRRTELFIDELKALVSYIKSIVGLLSDDAVREFKSKYSKEACNIFGEGATVTVPIFNMLLQSCGKWVSNKHFDSSNTQRRIQDIKEHGFTLSTKTEGRETFHCLLPFEKKEKSGYETFSSEVRKAIFAIHGGMDAFTGGQADTSSLPDHKFPEIRWNHSTPVSNDNLSQEEMFNKFQLVTEKTNQAKREVCRKCFQTGIRGKLNGINFFYKGGEHWDAAVPRTGKESEVGCVGCFWYDMVTWRNALNALIDGIE